MLSRNFRLQRVGDYKWLKENYNFALVSFYIDELVVLDISRASNDRVSFCETLKALTRGCFVPIAAGGGIRSVDHARMLLRSGADKIVVNTPLFSNPILVRSLANEFGQQCIVGSIDMKPTPQGDFEAFTDNGTKAVDGELRQRLSELDFTAIGEVYLNAIARDGTGQGYDFRILDFLPPSDVSVILAGGVGNATHLAEGLSNPRVDAVATAHLFNFVGDGLRKAREFIIANGFELATWPAGKIPPR